MGPKVGLDFRGEKKPSLFKISIISFPRWGEIFRPSRPVMGPTQPPVQWVPGLSRGQERPRRAADHSPPSSAVVMEE